MISLIIGSIALFLAFKQFGYRRYAGGIMNVPRGYEGKYHLMVFLFSVICPLVFFLMATLIWFPILKINDLSSPSMMFPIISGTLVGFIVVPIAITVATIVYSIMIIQKSRYRIKIRIFECLVVAFGVMNSLCTILLFSLGILEEIVKRFL